MLPAGKGVALSVLALALALLIGVFALLVAEAAVGAEKVAEERMRAMRLLRVMFLVGRVGSARVLVWQRRTRKSKVRKGMLVLVGGGGSVRVLVCGKGQGMVSEYKQALFWCKVCMTLGPVHTKRWHVVVVPTYTSRWGLHTATNHTTKEWRRRGAGGPTEQGAQRLWK